MAELNRYMDAVVESCRNSVSRVSTRFNVSVENEMADAGRDGRTRLARPILRRERGQGRIHFPFSAETTSCKIGILPC